MSNLKSHFIFSKSQQNGIVLLVVIIVVFQLIYFFVDFNTENELTPVDSKRLTHFQKQIDSLKDVQRLKDTLRIYPFNPNMITDYKGYTLGLSVEEIDRLLKFRSENRWVNSAKEFQAVTLVSDTLLSKIAPYFRFPEWVQKSNQKKNSIKDNSIKWGATNREDLNLVTQEDLIKLKGIGEVLASRIIKYRFKLGGFVSEIQLKDIYGLNFEARNEILKQYSIQTKPQVLLFNINKASVLEIASVPYLDYELAREIVDYRSLHERISTFEELAKIKDFPSEKIDRIALYLTLE